MSFLRRVFGGTSKEPEAPDEPQPLVLPGALGAENPITALLARWRLPLAERRSAIEARCGIEPDPIYGNPTVLLPSAVQLPGAMRPWSAYVSDRIAPQFPVTQFSGLVAFEDDSGANLRATVHYIAQSLGAAPIGQRWNTMVATWRSDMAAISLTVWPKHLQNGHADIPAEKRHPRLAHACHVQVATGFCLLLTDAEREWVETSRLLRPLATSSAVPSANAPHESELEYARRPALGTRLEPSLRISGDNDALVMIANQLLVIPRTSIRRLEVFRLTPAKGAGGAWLKAICDSAAPNPEGQSLFLAEHAKPDGLNGFARNLASQLGCALKIGEAYPDC